MLNYIVFKRGGKLELFKLIEKKETQLLLNEEQ